LGFLIVLAWFHLVLVVAFVVPCSVHAAAHGTPVFDPNSLGGNWACFRSVASGTCQGATAQNFNAACDGVTDDSAAMTAWLTWAVANGAAQSKLFIPPGCRLHFPSALSFLWDGTVGHAGVQNAIIWAYNVVADQVAFRGDTFFQDKVHSSRINTANINDTTVTLVTPAEASRFSIGDWVCISGLSLQTVGNPPNFQFFEFRTITNIVGGVISLSSALTKQYLSTWPLADPAGSLSFDMGGPATILKMSPSWNTTSSIYGLTVTAGSPGNVLSAGRQLAHYSVIFNGPINVPSVGVDISYHYSRLGGATEVDKEISNLTFDHVSGGQLIFQSASVDNATLNNVVLTDSLNGTANNTVINNSTFTDFASSGQILGAGSTSFGASTSLSVTNTTFATALGLAQRILASQLTYSSGTFQIANNSANFNQMVEWAVPGKKYYIASHDRTHCAPNIVFTITTVRQDATNTYADTGSWTSAGSGIATPGSLPTPTCNGAPDLDLYAASTITQSGGGPGDVTQFAAPP
jgi:hypothetical protein